MNTSDVLNHAADLIEKQGWGTGSSAMLGRAGVCIMGAIHYAQFGRFDKGDAGYDAVEQCAAGRAVSTYLGLENRPLWGWNDRRTWEGRGASEVIEVLRAAAVIEAARETEAVRVSA